MKTVLVLSILFYAAFAAPAEDKEKALDAAVVVPEEQMAAALEMEETMMKEEFVPEDSAPVPMNARNFCPDGWFSHGSRCFLFVNTPMSWYNAEEHCNAMGAHLASVSNPREYSFLQQMTTTGGQSIAWLGGFSLQGKWLWIDREGMYYTNWYCQVSSSSYPCMYLRNNNGWGNTQCGNAYRFICSKNMFGC
ncbi:ladderlectin-like [Scomber japonicus]|uniref:ladderlectin-like n=1 Tax=Scomber japonicus TaxID=13676 RepID=UPI0023061EAA|nr:ladderlectin-like [Scomber japonicus]